MLNFKKEGDYVWSISKDGFFEGFIHLSKNNILALSSYLGFTLEELKEIVEFMENLNNDNE